VIYAKDVSVEVTTRVVVVSEVTTSVVLTRLRVGTRLVRTSVVVCTVVVGIRETTVT
jgi:hypothetical protein